MIPKLIGLYTMECWRNFSQLPKPLEKILKDQDITKFSCISIHFPQSILKRKGESCHRTVLAWLASVLAKRNQGTWGLHSSWVHLEIQCTVWILPLKSKLCQTEIDRFPARRNLTLVQSVGVGQHGMSFHFTKFFEDMLKEVELSLSWVSMKVSVAKARIQFNLIQQAFIKCLVYAGLGWKNEDNKS